MKMRISVILAAVGVMSLAASSQAQMMDVMAATAATATLAEGQASSVVNAGYVDRARSATAAANANVANTAQQAQVPTSPGLPGAAGGFNPAPAQGAPPGLAPLPGSSDPSAPNAGGLPGAEGAGFAQPGAANGQPGAAPAVTPIPSAKVLTGRRATCAVTGIMMDAPVQIEVPFTLAQSGYQDDGISDNGIANDGIRGDVKVIEKGFMSAEANSIFIQMVNVVRQAESMAPLRMFNKAEPSLFYDEDMQSRLKRIENKYNRIGDIRSTMLFYRYHVATTDPMDTNPDMPKLLAKQEERDKNLTEWNRTFLAKFRPNPEEVRKGFYQVYIPKPPTMPSSPIPPGYQSPQARRSAGTGPNGQPLPPGAAPGATPTPNIYNGDAVLFGAYTK